MIGWGETRHGASTLYMYILENFFREGTQSQGLVSPSQNNRSRLIKHVGHLKKKATSWHRCCPNEHVQHLNNGYYSIHCALVVSICLGLCTHKEYFPLTHTHTHTLVTIRGYGEHVLTMFSYDIEQATSNSGVMWFVLESASCASSQRNWTTLWRYWYGRVGLCGKHAHARRHTHTNCSMHVVFCMISVCDWEGTHVHVLD